MKYIIAVDDFLAKIESVMLITFLSVMIGLSAVQIGLRNFFHTGISWADVFLRHLVLWTGFLGAALASKEGRHINIDVVSKILPAKYTPWIELVIDVFSAFICVLLGRAAWIFVADEMSFGGDLFLEIPTWIFQTIFPGAFIIIAFRFIVRGMKAFIEIVKGGQV